MKNSGLGRADQILKFDKKKKKKTRRMRLLQRQPSHGKRFGVKTSSSRIYYIIIYLYDDGATGRIILFLHFTHE